jgi:anthranilate synthase / indole-3-glycerol phosphate synthase / phosphoribosylanthranilate isomerase
MFRPTTQAWSASHSIPRPAILRKDFILDKYQILEARANGADTVLLIVAVLGVSQLEDLIGYCRRWDMEPLVEVHSPQEVDIALRCGAVVLGVNNRNLHSFQLDLDTTRRAVERLQASGKAWRPDQNRVPQITVAALSGISSRADVDDFRALGVSCCLVGETLMKSGDPVGTIKDLLGGAQAQTRTEEPLVKVCGMTDSADVSEALEGGVDLVGLIFAPSSPR